MTGELWASAFVAAMFAVHPQHVESVAWISERRDVLSGLLFMLCLGAYLGYVRHGCGVGRYLLLAMFFALALMAKAIVITLPPLLLLLDFWPLGRIGRANGIPAANALLQRPGALWLVLEKLPLMALAAVGALLALRTHAGGDVLIAAWPVRLSNAVVSSIVYIVQLFYPVNLAAFYPLVRTGLPAWQVFGAATILVTMSLAALLGHRRCQYVFVGWFWYLGMLVPVLGLINAGWYSAMADRYTYLSCIGLYVALAWGAERLVVGFPRRRLMLGTSAAIAIVALTACAIRQTTFWRDDETLWSHSLACTANNCEAEIGLAEALRRRGDFEQAMVHFLYATRFGTDYDAFNGLGRLLAQQNKLDEAIPQFRKALEMNPDAAQVHINLGLALMLKNQLRESQEHLRRALQIDPFDANAHCGLAHVLRRQGDVAGARSEFERAIEIEPQKAFAHFDLAALLVAQGEIDLAIQHLEAALAIEPRNVTGHIKLARALTARGRLAEAADHYRQANQLDPQNPLPREELNKLQH
jgi:tetratricopeptide (TPR) repeat protein